MFEKNLLLPCLLDIYGALLTDRKRELLDYYYEEDYSLSEISELTGISRQGIRDSIKKSEAELLDFESKLHLYEKKKAMASITADTRESINISLSQAKDSELAVLLSGVSARLDALEELL